MKTVKTMKSVDIADFVLYAQEKRKKEELDQMQKEISLCQFLTKIYKIEIVRMVLSVAILLCGCLILEALSR